MTWSILSIPVRSIERNSRLVKILINSAQLTWSILDSYLINQKGTFDQLKGILDRSKLMKLNFPKFSPSSFQRFFMNKLPSYEHNRLSLRLKNEFHWCYNLKVQFNTHLTSNWDIIITSISVLVNNSFNIYAENWLRNLLTLWNYLLRFKNSQNVLYKFEIEDRSDTSCRKNIVCIAYKIYAAKK